MTIENKIKYASKLNEVLFKTLYRLNHYVFFKQT